jgi:hypothetical protein
MLSLFTEAHQYRWDKDIFGECFYYIGFLPEEVSDVEISDVED